MTDGKVPYIGRDFREIVDNTLGDIYIYFFFCTTSHIAILYVERDDDVRSVASLLLHE